MKNEYLKTMERLSKTIERLSKKPPYQLTFNETVELIDAKYHAKQRITYEEYVILVASKYEAWFVYKDIEYQVDYGLENIVAMYVTVYNGTEKVSGKSVNFLSIFELLDKFRIEGKTIKEIWDEVIY